MCGGGGSGHGRVGDGVAEGNAGDAEAKKVKEETKKQLCYFCSKESKKDLNSNSNNESNQPFSRKEQFVDACRRRREQSK